MARNCDKDNLDVYQVNETWSAAQPLLERAASRNSESASGKSFALPHIRKDRRGIDCPLKDGSREYKARDVVAKVRARESIHGGPSKILSDEIYH